MAQKDVEKRFFKTEFRITRKEDGALPKIEGYAAVFNSDSEDMGFIERIRPKAFRDALKSSDARALFNHDPNYILGRQSNGTLTLTEDKKGLHMSVSPPDTQLVRDMVLAPIERGDITQQSFGFTIEKDSWEGLDSDKPTRTIEKVKEVFDVSPVTYPAYSDTEVALRSMKEAQDNQNGKGGDVRNGKKEAEEVKPQITIINDIDDDHQDVYHFTGENRYKEAAIEMEVIRSEACPLTPAEDGAVNDPLIDKKTDTVEAKDDLLERIKQKIGELEK